MLSNHSKSLGNCCMFAYITLFILFANSAYPHNMGSSILPNRFKETTEYANTFLTNEDKYDIPWTDSIPEPIFYYDLSYYKRVINWISKSQKCQMYRERGSMASFIENHTILWKRTGSGFSSKKFDTGSRFCAASGFEENYSDPFQGLLHHPEGVFSFSLTNNTLTLTNEDQIQVSCRPNPKTGKPMKPSDGATECFGCKTGTRKGTAEIQLFGSSLKLTYTVSCKHNTYQSSYFNVVYGDGTPVNQSRDAHHMDINRGVRPNGSRVRNNDDYAPWRQIHTQSIKFNLDEISRINKISKKELVARMILAHKWYLPLVSDEAKQKYNYFEWREMTDNDLIYGENLEHALLTFFLWKQFGISEEYLNEFIKKTGREKKERIAKLLLPYIISTKFTLKKARSNIHINNKEGLEYYKKSAVILNAAYAECQRAEIVELIDSIRAITNLHSISQIYYASKDGITLPEHNLSLCLKSIKDSFPQKEMIEFLSECRDNAFNAARYNQVGIIADFLQPIIKSYGNDNLEQEFENYHMMIFALLRKGANDKAIAKATEFIDNNPSSVLPYEILCYIYAFQKNKKAAMDIWKNHLLKSDKKYAANHPNSYVCNLLKQLKWIKNK